MKKQFMVLAVSSFTLLMACNDNGNTTTDSTTDTMTTTSTTTASTDNMAATTDSDGMPIFYSLDTKQPVKVMEDENSHQYVDVSTHKPLTYYYEPISRDTFDSRGRLVNNALILTDGNYSLDEAKIKSNDNAFKIKADDWKMKYGKDGDNKMKTDDAKIKDKGDKYKVKTDDTKIKVTDDGEVKVKDK
ncbi:MAG: hypothetical protein ABIR31_10830 [Ginsengibacter sp.]